MGVFPQEIASGMGAPQIPPLRSPEFLSRLAALANFMRLSLMKAAHVDLSDVAKQEFGYATVGMTSLFGGRGMEVLDLVMGDPTRIPASSGVSCLPRERGWQEFGEQVVVVGLELREIRLGVTL